MIDNIIRKVEVAERKEKRKRDRLVGVLKKQRQVEISRLNNLLEDRKERLRTQILRKREIFEELLMQEVRLEAQEVLASSEQPLPNPFFENASTEDEDVEV